MNFWETLTPWEDRLVWRLRAADVPFPEIEARIRARRIMQCAKRGWAQTEWKKWIALKWRAEWRECLRA